MSNPDGRSAQITPDDWERIARYITGEAGSSEAAITKRWVEADPHRVEVVRLLESIIANVARDDSSDVDAESALTNVKGRFDKPKMVPFRVPSLREARPITTPLLRVAAAMIIIIGGAMLWQNLRKSGLDASAPTFATSVGERRQVVLEDGTRVILGPTSRLVVVFRSEGERTVTLDGIAYFNVVHNRARPFTVRAGRVIIQDIGTAFSVVNDDSAGTRVAVDSGSVSIAAPDQNDSPEAVLGAHDRATVDPRGIVVVERSAVSDDDLAWVQGRLVFRDAPLILVAAELYRWYGVRLSVADSSLANLHLTASFSGEPVERVLNVIALSLGAHIERKGNSAILHRTTTSGALPKR